MSVALYPHNREAYYSALSMLKSENRAAVVHPTGTGKSFIAFRLCEDYAPKPALWLSPSRVIFQTQTENYRAAGGEIPENIRFLTYAKLANMSNEEINALQPGFIVLDEFHRGGAQVWGDALRRLLNRYPGVPALGLSATSVRYLDNRRDMGEELFSGHIASFMTLGDAIVRGILPAPKYVATVYRAQNHWQTLRERVENNPNDRRENEKLLESLRRALEKARGLDKVFTAYMTEKSGKYILFCSGIDSIRELSAHTEEWFGGVNRKIHTYLAYSSDPDTEKSFAAFKSDDSDALKLLFCINMLNEGVHVRGISGVILFRPTVSPIIYKQQIGRALTAGNGHVPLIIDVVNNFEGLCSIDGIREETQLAVRQCRQRGEEPAVEGFEIIEEAKDCRELFTALERSLAGGWERYYRSAREYYREHGNLRVPAEYRDADGLHLGEWIITQRAVRSGRRGGVLTEEQIEKLSAIGMEWDNRLDAAWNNAYAHCEAYAAEYGDLEVPLRYRSPDGYALGAFINRVRSRYANGERRGALSLERIACLESLGMRWSAINAKWERNYLRAAEYYREHGDLMVPATYKTRDGYPLGGWIRNLRRSRRAGNTLTAEQTERLDAIGMFWGSRRDEEWESNFTEAEKYYRRHGDLNPASGYRTAGGKALGKWVADLRLQRKRGEARLTTERIARLDSIGMVWEKPDSWEYRYELSRKYLEEHPSGGIPYGYRTADGIPLGVWFYRQRRIAQGYPSRQKLNDRQLRMIQRLEETRA